MDVATPRVPTFGGDHFGAAKLGNRSRTARLVETVNHMVAHPGGTLPDKLNRPADLRAFYRLVNRDEVTHAAVLAPHVAHTLGLMRATSETVLILNDTTEIDLTGLTTLIDQVGQIGNGSRRGYLCHNSLAVAAGSRAVLGLVNQALHTRPHADKTESRAARRQKDDRESRLWVEGSKAVGPSPAGRLWVDVCDRGGDTFEYLDFMRRKSRHFVVRCRHDRLVFVEKPGGSAQVKLHAYARSLPELGRRVVEVPAAEGRPKRTATMRIAAAPVAVQAPKNPRGEHGREPLAGWVVYAGEIDPPAGTEPLEWFLLTNVPTTTFAEASERVDWYATRWVVEEFHKAMKTGCGIETMQFTTTGAMEPAMAVMSVLAVFLLQLRDASRAEATQGCPATEFVPESYVRVMSIWRYKALKPAITVKEFYFAVARLGGHQNRKCDGFPGWLVLWRGWTKLQTLHEGAEIAEQMKHGKT